MRVTSWLKGLLLSVACLIAALGSWQASKPSRGRMRALSAALMGQIRGTGAFSACAYTTSCGVPCSTIAGGYYGWTRASFKQCEGYPYPSCTDDNTVCYYYQYEDARCTTVLLPDGSKNVASCGPTP
jgi:hypothetical protein